MLRLIIIAAIFFLPNVLDAQTDMTKKELKAYNKDNGLKLLNRETRNQRVIPLNSQVTLVYGEDLIKGIMTGIGIDYVVVDGVHYEFTKLQSIGHRNGWTKAKGAGIVVLGTGMFIGGILFTIGSSQPTLGVAGVVTSVAVVSMAPSVFRHGNRFHLDGEWMIPPQEIN